MKSSYSVFAITIVFVSFGSVTAKEKEPSAAAKQGAGMTMMDMMGKSNISCMSMCMDMMNMMGGMMGGGMMGKGKSEGGMMGGGMGGKMQGEDKSPATEKKDEAGENEKHHPK